MFATGSTVGQRILDVCYGNTHGSESRAGIGPYKKVLYAALLIGCPWLKERSGDLIKRTQLEQWRDVVRSVLILIQLTGPDGAMANGLVRTGFAS